MRFERKFRQASLCALLLTALSIFPGAMGGCTYQEKEGQKVQAPPGGLFLKGAGATFPSLLYKQWFAAYPKEHPGTIISYDSVGSGEGIRRFIGNNIKEHDRVDFGASDAAMNDEDMAKVPGGVVLVPLTAGSVVLAYNLPEFEGDLRLSRKAYIGIFSGEIRTWNDPVIAASNPGKRLPKRTITLVVRQDKSGTTYAFTKHLDAISETWRSRYGAATLVDWPGDAMRATGNEGVAGRIEHAVGSIGYVSFEFARNLGLKLAVLENREGHFVAPSGPGGTSALAAVDMPENLRVFVPDPTGPDSYPIVTLSWVLLYKKYDDPGKARALRDLFRWCLTEGQNYAPQLNYIKLPQSVADKALAALDTVM